MVVENRGRGGGQEAPEAGKSVWEGRPTWRERTET